ncbi:LytTR family transcriptional regulator DNA-binding domain-containing protein [Ligilactobacillus sp. WILCCON 0076]|uniref:LytTR family transcriptional regulator DNA-binding domain-containing protein n=1 Tax=Ligilactobacillus ubinensis TaxID=2876789 RepID=A0A9X2FFW9_9LACO|nr:LytTR family transcriptional regulator DNA-binding domain-containing protein [Ligilactobacillus ubinensis]MCP0885787.1 LytTR family transcriptional regulator DNA-binding domain-containing protein [Ligilactobacillus ubinensis]
MNILIVDDEALAREELKYLVKQSLSIKDKAIFLAEDVHEAQDILLKKKIDLIFLDISLNDENGFDLADELNQLAHPPLVIFATAYDEYAVQAFEIDAVDYILKPFEQGRIDKALAKVAKLIAVPKKHEEVGQTEHKTNEFITINLVDRGIVLKKSDIVAGTIEQGELTLTTLQHEYKLKNTLAWLKSRLTDERFIQIHRNTMVNLMQIKEVQPWFNHTALVIMTTGLKFPVGRSYLKKLNMKLGL